jgi:hypothetical protein
LQIEYIQFERHSASASMGTQAKTFDLLVHLKTEVSFPFCLTLCFKKGQSAEGIRFNLAPALHWLPFRIHAG